MCVELPKLGGGAEHDVYYEPFNELEFSNLIKVTIASGFGEYYRLVGNQVSQRKNTPWEYLTRMDLISETFGLPCEPIGITDRGQIVTRQKFIDGGDL